MELKERIAELKARATEAWEAKQKAADPGHPPRRTPWGDGTPKGEYVQVCKTLHNTMQTDDADHQRFQDYGDLMLLAKSIAREDVSWKGNPEGLTDWLLHESDLGRAYRENQAIVVQKAMDEGTATEGGNWVPTTFSPRLHEKYRLPLKVTPLFEEIPMSSNNHDEYVDGPDLDARKGSETNSDDVYASAALMPAITPTTYKTTFGAVDIQARTSVSSQLEADSVIRVTQKLQNKLQIAHARAKDVAILMGDVTTVTYPDNDVAIDATIASRAERLWNGLRYMTNAGARINCNGLAITTARIRQARAAMGVYGANPEDCVLIFGVRGEAQLLNLPELITLDKFGPQASILTGQVGKVDGMPVIISEKCKEDVSATGYNTAGGPNTFIQGFLVNTKAFGYGLRERLTILTVPLPLSRQVAVASFERGDFEELVYDITAVNPVAWFYNLPQTP